jgi:hypothetical protein
VCGVLGVAFYYQFALGELPCPLCALQRVGFIVAGVGLVLNLRVGYSRMFQGIYDSGTKYGASAEQFGILNANAGGAAPGIKPPPMTAYLPSSVALPQLIGLSPSADVSLPVPSRAPAIKAPAIRTTPAVRTTICLVAI